MSSAFFTRVGALELTISVKIIRASPHADDEAELVDALVHGWCAFDGASEEVWDSFGDERGEVSETTGSALEVSCAFTLGGT